MPPSVRALSTDWQGNTPNATAALPAGTTSGDLLLAIATSDRDGNLTAMTAPAGWTSIGTHGPGSGVPHMKVWQKVATGSEPSTYTFPDSDGANAAVVILAITDYDATTPLAVSPTFSSSSTTSTSHVAPSVTGVVDGLLVTAHLGAANGTSRSYTPPTGMTEVADVMSGSSGWVVLEVNTLALSAAGATGTKTATCSGATAWLTMSLVVAPGSSTPPPSGSGTPSVRSRTSGAQNTATTSHSISLPAGVVAGDLLLVCFTNDESTDPTTVSTTSTGWALLDSIEQGTTTNHRCSVFWKRATGSDALTVTTAFSQESTHVSICAQDAGDPVLASNSGGSATTAGVTALTGLTSGNYLSVLFCGTDASTTTSQSVTAPSGYGNVVSQNPSTTSSAATFSMDQVLTGVTSISPGSITLGATEQWVTFHVAAAGVASGPEPGRFLLSR